MLTRSILFFMICVLTALSGCEDHAGSELIGVSFGDGPRDLVVSSVFDAGLKSVYVSGDDVVGVGINGAIVRSEDGGKSWASVASGTDKPRNGS